MKNSIFIRAVRANFLTRVTLAAALVALVGTQPGKAANSELDAKGAGTYDLTLSTSYTQGTAPATTSDVTIGSGISGTYNVGGTVANSNLNIGTLNALSGIAATISNGSGGTDTITLNGGMNTVAPAGTNGGNAGDLIFQKSGASLTISTTTLALASTASGGSFDINGGNVATISSALSGTADFTKTGSGTLALTSTVTTAYVGTVTINGGVLNIVTNSNTGAGGIGGSNKIVIDANSFLQVNNKVANQTSDFGLLSGAGGLITSVNGTGTSINLNEANTYTGTTQIISGALKTSVDSSFNTTGDYTSGATSGAIGVNSALVLTTNNKTDLDVNGHIVEVGSLTAATQYGGSGIALDGGTLITGGDNTSTTFADDISDTTVDGSGYSVTGTGGKLVKIGTGTQTLTGTGTYSGGTTILGGTLQAGNATALGTGNVTVSGGTGSTAGAVGTLQGTVAQVKIGGNLGLSGTGVLDAEATGTGKFTLTGSSNSFAITGGTWDLDITSPTDYDSVTSSTGTTNTFSITGGILDLTGDTLAIGSTYDIISGFTSGSGAGFSSITGYDKSAYTVTFDDTSSPGVGELVVSAAPEPSTWAMMLGGVVLLVTIQRRRLSRI